MLKLAPNIVAKTLPVCIQGTVPLSKSGSAKEKKTGHLFPDVGN